MTKKEQRALLAEVIAYLEPIGSPVLLDLRRLLADMHNRPPVTRGQKSSVPMTPAVRAEIRQIHARDPDLNQKQIGEIVNVNNGRVSETLGGVRT